MVKSAIRRKSRVYRRWVTCGSKPNDHIKVGEVQNSTNKIIREAKRSYFEKLIRKVEKNLFGARLKELYIYTYIHNKKLTNIPRPFLTIIITLRILSKRLNFLMIISPNKIHDNVSVYL